MTKTGRVRLMTFTSILFALFVSISISRTDVHAGTSWLYKESTYSHVYNYSYYLSHNSGVKKKYKGNRFLTLVHFVNYGMKEGRQGNSTFNVSYYGTNYPSLKSRYSKKNLYIHYQFYGYKEGRIADKLLKNQKFTVTIKPNGGTYNGSSKNTTLTKYYGTTVTLATPKRSGYTFTGWKVSGGGSVSGSTYKFTMNTTKTTNVVTATWQKTTYTAVATSTGKENMVKFALSKVGTGGSETWKYWGYEAEWCCMFVSYCADKGGGLIDTTAGEGVWGSGALPKYAGQRQLAAALAARGQIKLASSGYQPQRGDLIFFSNYSNKSYYAGYRHVGIVTGSDADKVYTVEGNTVTYNKYTSKVAQKSYDLDSSKIASYGIIK